MIAFVFFFSLSGYHITFVETRSTKNPETLKLIRKFKVKSQGTKQTGQLRTSNSRQQTSKPKIGNCNNKHPCNLQMDNLNNLDFYIEKSKKCWVRVFLPMKEDQFNHAQKFSSMYKKFIFFMKNSKKHENARIKSSIFSLSGIDLLVQRKFVSFYISKKDTVISIHLL